MDWYTSCHLLCASTNCVHGVVPVPVNWYNIVTGGLCVGSKDPRAFEVIITVLLTDSPTKK